MKALLPTPEPFQQVIDFDLYHLAYADQIALKEQHLRDLFKSAITSDTSIAPFRRMPGINPLYFRNKTRFAFSKEGDRVVLSRQAGNAIPPHPAFLTSEAATQTAAFIASYAEQAGWELFDSQTSAGWLKHLDVRESKSSGDYMLVIVTAEPELNDASFITSLYQRFPKLKSLHQLITSGRNNENGRYRALAGEEYIYETMGIFQFRLSPGSFFQNNTFMAEQLYNAIRASLPEHSSLIWDLYAGSATIAAWCSDKADNIWAIERNPRNCQDATWNLTHNDITNVQVIEGRVEDCLMRADPDPEALIIDPPRSGLTRAGLTDLLKAGAPQITYASCEPQTCLRDCLTLIENGYVLSSLQGFDMFPHTTHIETIAVLNRI